MTIIRKIVFITLSISGLIYLVLQTSHGQLWLSQTHQSIFGEQSKDEQGSSLSEPTKDALVDSFTVFLKNSKHAEQILALEIELHDMQTAISDIAIAMHKVTALNVTLHEQVTLLGNAQIQQSPGSNLSTKMASSSTMLQQPTAVVSVVEKRQNKVVKQPFVILKAGKKNTKMSQLEHQARLQEVVQRMELTALQAISR